MKVLILNGSPRVNGNTSIAVNELVKTFDAEGIETEVCQIWYYAAPNVVNTFCKNYDWNGKSIHIFATSRSSGIGKTAAKLEPYVTGASIADAKRVTSASEVV